MLMAALVSGVRATPYHHCPFGALICGLSLQGHIEQRFEVAR